MLRTTLPIIILLLLISPLSVLYWVHLEGPFAPRKPWARLQLATHGISGGIPLTPPCEQQWMLVANGANHITIDSSGVSSHATPGGWDVEYESPLQVFGQKRYGTDTLVDARFRGVGFAYPIIAAPTLGGGHWRIELHVSRTGTFTLALRDTAHTVLLTQFVFNTTTDENTWSSRVKVDSCGRHVVYDAHFADVNEEFIFFKIAGSARLGAEGK
jgi:hypothetical protein